MILSTSGILASISGIVYDDDALAFFQRVSDATGTLSLTEKQAVNQLVLDLKANSLWTPMKAIYPMVGASAAACAQNLKSSSFTGTFTSGWTFASTGVTPNGTSAYMDTIFKPSTGFNSNNDISFGYYNNENMTSPSTSMGCTDLALAKGCYLIANVGGVSYNKVSSDVGQAYSGTFTTGLYSLIRTISTEFKYYKNNSLLNTQLASSTGRSSANFYIGAVNLTSSVEYEKGRCAYAFMGDGLTATQIGTNYTIIQNFNTTLSRQV
jgi:hypothetical protein